MNIVYNDKADLLYIRFEDSRQDVINRRISEHLVLDIGEDDRIVGIEIIDASRHVALEKLLFPLPDPKLFDPKLCSRLRRREMLRICWSSETENSPRSI